jgi:thiol:disulfide interchange protein DsbC
VLYTDEQGQYVFQGSLIDTKSRANLTEARIAKLTQIDFASLPLKDAILIKPGTGARKLVVFGDPNCGYCKKLERELLSLKDVDLHLPLSDPRPRFERQGARYLVYAIRARSGAAGWSRATRRPRRWALRQLGARAQYGIGRSRVSGTPAVVFEDGSRSPGPSQPTSGADRRRQAPPRPRTRWRVRPATARDNARHMPRYRVEPADRHAISFASR